MAGSTDMARSQCVTRHVSKLRSIPLEASWASHFDLNCSSRMRGGGWRVSYLWGRRPLPRFPNPTQFSSDMTSSGRHKGRFSTDPLPVAFFVVVGLFVVVCGRLPWPAPGWEGGSLEAQNKLRAACCLVLPSDRSYDNFLNNRRPSTSYY